jgi:heme A synthase
MKGYPSWFISALLGTLLLVFVSGCLLAPTTLVMRLDADLAWRLPGAGRVAVAAMHAAAGLLTFAWLGSLWTVHMRINWRRHRQRVSGAALGILLLVLAASAVGVYYLGDDTLGTAAALLHLGCGLALAAPFGGHWFAARAARRQASEPQRALQPDH